MKSVSNMFPLCDRWQLALESLSDAEVTRAAEAALRALLPGDWRLEAVALWRWGRDPHARGAYSFDALGANPHM